MNDFIIGKIIGKGAFGSVSLVTRKNDGKIYAMKRVNIGKLNNKEKESSLNEIRILASLSHPNIIGYKEAFFDESTNTLNIVMEFADEGDLEKKIKNNLKKRLNFEEDTIWRWIIQLLKGIKYLHDNRIMHRDLKCANIFLMKNGLLKLGDLNVSKFSKIGMANTQTGTPYYCSPEIWKGNSYDYKSDIWSLGCIIYEICSLRPPFRGTSLKGLMNNVLNGNYPPIPSNYSKELSLLISKMLVIEPNKRASANELLKDEIVVSKIRSINNNIYNNNIKEGYNLQKANLIKTIRLPLNIKEINSKLPKKRYNPEEEMMKNDEYETMKQTFFQNLNKQKNKKNIKNHEVYNNNKREISKNKKGNLNNYQRKDNKEKLHENNNHEKQNKNFYQKQNNNHYYLNNNKEINKNDDYLYNKNLNYQYEQALKNNYKLKKFNSHLNNQEEIKIKNEHKYNELIEKFNMNNNYIYDDKNGKINNNLENQNLIINNINNKNYIKLENNFPNSPYNLILNKNQNDNFEVKNKNRYKNLYNDENNFPNNENYNNKKKKFSNEKIIINPPKSALQRKNKLNIESNANNKILNRPKKRPITSMPTNNNLNKQNNKNINKNNAKINNLYDKYKNKEKEKKNLYGFKYVPQKRKVYNIKYDKVNYNDYCKKNNIDKNKNYHYYRQNGYYNYRNEMKKYGNFVQNKNVIHKSNKNELQNNNKFNNYLKNEYKGGGGAGYAAKLRKKYNK